MSYAFLQSLKTLDGTTSANRSFLVSKINISLTQN